MLYHINKIHTGDPDLDILAGVVLQAVRDAQSGDPLLAPSALLWLQEFAPEVVEAWGLELPEVYQPALFEFA